MMIRTIVFVVGLLGLLGIGYRLETSPEPLVVSESISCAEVGDKLLCIDGPQNAEIPCERPLDDVVMCRGGKIDEAALLELATPADTDTAGAVHVRALCQGL